MTDRELLELAAKAAGMKDGTWFDGYNDQGNDTGDHWNPLHDDGDALRLAVKLGVKNYFGIEVQNTCTQCTAFEPWEHVEYEEHDKDLYAATRRAIVRAAAEIGKGMV